jgi:hypothetical protein
MIHQAMTVMTVLGNTQIKGRKCTQSCSANVVQTRSLQFYIPYLPCCSFIAKKNIFSKVKALEMLHSMGLRADTFACIAFNASKKCFRYELDNLIKSRFYGI